MKRVLVLSDSHGNVGRMETAVEATKPDLIIHLGDCITDARELQERYPRIRMEMVPGNCDCSLDDSERMLVIEGHYVMLCHGHTRQVKNHVFSLLMAAKEKGAELALFGHTHMVFQDWHEGVRLYNPGSIGSPGLHIPPSYGVITFTEKDIHMETVYME